MNWGLLESEPEACWLAEPRIGACTARGAGDRPKGACYVRTPCSPPTSLAANGAGKANSRCCCGCMQCSACSGRSRLPSLPSPPALPPILDAP